MLQYPNYVFVKNLNRLFIISQNIIYNVGIRNRDPLTNEREVMSNSLVLTRDAFTPWGTFGRLQFPTGESVYTIERPWLDNETYVSCIPNGVYTMEKRNSPVVQRTSGGEYQEGWEVTDVIDRTFIMLHPANWMDDLAGCIGVGKHYVISQNKKAQWVPSVLSSRVAFGEVMGLLDRHNEWTLDIRPFIMSVF